jgi:hypothetical protein
MWLDNHQSKFALFCINQQKERGKRKRRERNKEERKKKDRIKEEGKEG